MSGKIFFTQRISIDEYFSTKKMLMKANAKSISGDKIYKTGKKN
jgi:hypothetical protein